MHNVITQVIKHTIDRYSIKDRMQFETRATSECTVRQMTEEEKAKYAGIQGHGKKAMGVNLWPRAKKGA